MFHRVNKPDATPGSDKPRRRRCKNCGELFPKTRHNREFCSDACRKEHHRHGGAFVPLKDACEKFINIRLAGVATELQLSREKAEQLRETAERLITGLQEAAAVLKRERQQLDSMTTELRQARRQETQAALLLQTAMTALQQRSPAPTPTTTTPTTTPTPEN